MRLMILLALLLVSGSLSAQTQGAIKRVRHVARFELAVACIKKYEGLHGPKHHPYVGYGHKLLPGERFSPRMTERQADALLRSDLRKLCAIFRAFGRDSLLLAALAYNVGCGKVMKVGCTPRCEVATETSIVTMWTSKDGTERLCLPSSEEEKWSTCSCLLHNIKV